MSFLWLLTQLLRIGDAPIECAAWPRYYPTYLAGQESRNKDQILKEEMTFDPAPPKNLNWGQKLINCCPDILL